VALITNNPFTRGIGSSAKIFPQKHGGTSPKLGPCLFYKINFSFHILNRLLIKQVTVCGGCKRVSWFRT